MALYADLGEVPKAAVGDRQQLAKEVIARHNWSGPCLELKLPRLVFEQTIAIWSFLEHGGAIVRRYGMRLLHVGELLLMASIPGAILPAICFLLFSYNSTSDARDVWPAVYNTWGAIGFCGMLTLALPIWAVAAALEIMWRDAQAQGRLFPYFDMLTLGTQRDIMMAIGFVVNVALWLLLVWTIDWLLRRWKLKHKWD